MNYGACLRRSSAGSSVALHRAEPIHRLLHERRSQLNSAPDLCRKIVEALGPKCAGGALVCCRKHRCYGEMETCLKGDGLVYDSKTAIELFELAAHKTKATIYRDIAGIMVRTKELSEGGLNECRLACARTLGAARPLVPIGKRLFWVS